MVLRYAISDAKIRVVTNSLGFYFYTYTTRLFIPKRNIHLVRLVVPRNQADAANIVVLNALNTVENEEGHGGR